MAVNKQRLDLLLVERQLCTSRQQAQVVIQAGLVKVNQQITDKPGTLVKLESIVEVQQLPRYVSRGGEKLAKALNLFPIEVKERICLDGGISTGGFTDCLLQEGAQRVYGVDVGYGQVAWRLRCDQRLILKERTNFRHLTVNTLYEGEQEANLGVIDLSFISLTKVLPTLWSLLVPPREVILLIKPQFEVGKSKIGKKGVVRDWSDMGGAIYQVWDSARSLGWYYHGLTWSPITGAEGNVEYLLWLKDEGNTIVQLEQCLTTAREAVNHFYSTS